MSLGTSIKACNYRLALFIVQWDPNLIYRKIFCTRINISMQQNKEIHHIYLININIALIW